MKDEYLFLRLRWLSAGMISAELNKYAKEGWVVVSHTATTEITVILCRPVGRS